MTAVVVPDTGEVLDVAPAAWHANAVAARDDGLTWFGWLTGVDDPAAGTVTVLLWVSTPRGERSRLLRTAVGRDGGRLASIRDVYAGASWAERETAEMLGVTFDGGDPRRLLLPPGEESCPLRRDTVLVTRQVVPWPGAVEPAGRARRRATPPGVVPGWGMKP